MNQFRIEDDCASVRCLLLGIENASKELPEFNHKSVDCYAFLVTTPSEAYYFPVDGTPDDTYPEELCIAVWLHEHNYEVPYTMKPFRYPTLENFNQDLLQTALNKERPPKARVVAELAALPWAFHPSEECIQYYKEKHDTMQANRQASVRRMLQQLLGGQQ